MAGITMQPLHTKEFSVVRQTSGAYTISRVTDEPCYRYLATAVHKFDNRGQQPLTVESPHYASNKPAFCRKALQWVAKQCNAEASDWTISAAAVIPVGLSVEPEWDFGWDYKIFDGLRFVATVRRVQQGWVVERTKLGNAHLCQSLQQAIDCAGAVVQPAAA